MKNFIICLTVICVWGCNQKTEDENQPIEIKITMAGSSLSALLESAAAPQAAAHILNLLEKNVFDGANITKKEDHIIVSPDQKVKSNAISIKIPHEQSLVNKTSLVWGLIRSPILEVGDSKLYFCYKSCQNLGSEYTAVGTFEFVDQANFENFQSGQKVLTVLKK